MAPVDKLQFSNVYKGRITSAGCKLILTQGMGGISYCGPEFKHMIRSCKTLGFKQW